MHLNKVLRLRKVLNFKGEDGENMLTDRALDNIKVIDLSRLLPGPYCSMVLADHGAEVIAIEDRRFQADDLFFSDMNRNKRHMTLNLKSDEGREIFFKLASQADVILEGFRPGVVERLGVDYGVIQKINPAIIYCSISGYGQDGPLKNCVGHDVNYLSRAGVLDLIGERGGLPVIPAVQFADIAGGGMNGVIGILLALFERQQSGQGQYIDISMTDSMLGFLALPYFLKKKTGQQQKRSETMLSHYFACYNTYKTKDDRYLAIGAVENRFWKNLCNHLNIPEYTALQYDEIRREEIVERLREIFNQKTLIQWEEELSFVEVCFSKIQNMEEVFSDSLFQDRGMIVDMENGGRVQKVLGIPVKMSRTPGAIRSAPQEFGGATKDILRELGYNDAVIQIFFDTKVV